MRDVANRCSNLFSSNLLAQVQTVLQFNKNEWTIFIRLTEKSIVMKAELSLPSLRNTKLACFTTVYICTYVKISLILFSLLRRSLKFRVVPCDRTMFLSLYSTEYMK
jgi:hypothetical protein